MANVCCISGCTAVPAQDLYYFKLPTKPALRRRWLEVINPCSKLSSDASVCSEHFDISDYETVRGRTRLKRDKVPSAVKVVQKSQSTDDLADQSNDNKKDRKRKKSDSQDNKTDGQTKTKELDSEKTKEKSKISKRKTRNHEKCNEKVKENNKNTSDELESKIEKENVTADELGEETDSAGDEQGGETGDQTEKGDKETHTDLECDALEMNGAQEMHDTNAVEIQITPDIMEDYSSIQVTPDIVEDYDALKPPDPMEPDITHDIEDILTNYHIMNPPGRRDRDQPIEQPEKVDDSSEKPTEKVSKKPPVTEKQKNKSPEKKIDEPVEKPTVIDDDNDDVQTIDDDDDLPLGVSRKPVFIEIPVDKGRNKESDCLMVVESLQVSVDPSALMLSEPDEIDDEIQDDDDKNHDPISLLTSSDEDEVIIEEPHIDTVEVSDETDEDDVPLVRLVKSENCDVENVDISKIFWGGHEFYCKNCNFATFSTTLYRNHLKTHNTTALQICQVCGFTTASEYQFARHKKKHRDDKKYKCHLCDYKARHNMSLIYHLKTHEGTNNAKVIKSMNRCKKCGFKSNVKSLMMKHVKNCRGKVFSCIKCTYSTKRNSDLKRHMMRKHVDSDDEDWNV